MKEIKEKVESRIKIVEEIEKTIGEVKKELKKVKKEKRMKKGERKKLGVYLELVDSDLWILKSDTTKLKEHIRAIKTITETEKK